MHGHFTLICCFRVTSSIFSNLRIIAPLPVRLSDVISFSQFSSPAIAMCHALANIYEKYAKSDVSGSLVDVCGVNCKLLLMLFTLQNILILTAKRRSSEPVPIIHQ